MNRIDTTTWNEKPGTNSYADGIAQMLIGSRIEGHVFAKYAPLIIKCAFENIRRHKQEG
jgi:hypothetical protein